MLEVCFVLAGASVVDESRRVFVRSFGCSSNLADGEVIVGCLLEAGYDVVEEAGDAYTLIYNTCAVKTPTENRLIELLRTKGLERGKRLIVVGCLPLINFERLRTEVRFDAALGPGPGARIVDVLGRVLQGERVVWLDGPSGAKPCLDLPRRAVNPVVSIVPVAYGCLGSCSYCSVVLARGRLRSCGIDEIVDRIRRDLSSGTKEIWLTGQDVACFGRDTGAKLPGLLQEVCVINGRFLVRIGMMTPNHVLEMLPELIEAFQDEHIFKFLHLPVQSGDDSVLARMNRFYSVEDFKYIVDSFRKAIPRITVATDVICGFPGESEEAFERTLGLIKKTRPDVVNVSKFFPRPRTSAGNMELQVTPREVKRRSKRMAEVARQISADKNRAWMNWEGAVLIDEIGKKQGSWIGRNFAYKPIAVKSLGKSMLGRFVHVRVMKSFQTYLEAEVVSPPVNQHLDGSG